MNCRLIILMVLLFIYPKQSHAIVFNGTDYPVPADGITDAQPGFRALFSAVATVPGNKAVVIPRGKYLMGLNSAANQIALPSNTSVDASAAQFLFPTNLPSTNAAYPFPLAFSSVDVTNLTWTGGSVLGYCFDLNATDPSTNVWKPRETPGFLYFSSTSGHGCENITIQNLSATNLSGPVVSFNGIGSGTDWAATTTTTCRNLMLTNCAFINCGLFAWDYSYLLQIVCYSNHYSAGQWWMATNYMPPGAIIGPVTTTVGSSLVGFSNPGLVALNTNSSSTKNQCSFYGIPPSSTPQIVAGNPYFIVGTNANGILVSPYQGGAPVVFTGTSSGSMGLVPNINAAGVSTYFPYRQSGSVFSGAYWFIDCDSVIVANCTWSSPGDSSDFYRTSNILMANNQVLPVRMGVLFLGYGCKNATITNNQFNIGSAGSRAITLEYASNINITGNTFNGGGRGSMIVNAEQTTIANNIFRTNTTKAYQDYSIGRIGPEYGGFWEIHSVFEFNSDGTHNNCIVFTNNLVQTDSAFYFMIFNSGWYTNSIITDNIIYGTRIDGSDASQGLVYGYPAPPPFAFRCIHFNSSIARNSGLDMASDGTFCTVTTTPTSQLSFPHHLPVVWPSQSTGLYTNSGTAAFQTSAAYGPTNYLATVTPISPLSPGISSYSMDATNISVNFAGTIPSNTPVTLGWTAQQFLNFGQDFDIENYLTRVTTDGVNLSAVSWIAFYKVAGAFKNVGWSHFIEIYPLWGTGPAYLEKLKSADGELRLRNVGMTGSTTPPFLPTDFGSRGLTGDGLSKSLQLSLTPGAINSGLKGGFSVFVNNSTGFTPSSGSYLMGVDDGVNQYGLQWTGTGVRGTFGGNGIAATLSGPTLGSPMLYTVSRTSPTSLLLYTNGVLAATSSVSTSDGGSTRNIRLFARAGADNNPSAHFNGTLAFAFIDDGALSAANYAYLNNAIRSWLTNVNELP